VPVVVADVKGDLSGLAAAGTLTPKLGERLQSIGVPPPEWSAAPVVFWDVFGRRGVPIRVTISDLGPLLLGRLLGLNAVQQGVLTLVFKVADDSGMLLLDLKDLRAMLQFAGDHARDLTTAYGNVSVASIGAIQRGLLAIEHEGGAALFGEPMLDVGDLVQTDEKGRGIVNVIAAEELIRAPRVYATMLLWLLSELFERLPEVGDPDTPILVFFFDEAHLLFDGAPDPLVEKIEQVVRLIRSKGVGVYFVTQNPSDIPNDVLGQLGNRVQHALRAFTPRDQKGVRAAAETLRPNPELDVERAIGELSVGEALVSLLDPKGTPAVTERAWILPPLSRIGPLSETERAAAVRSAALLSSHYGQVVDRESAYEKLKARALSEQPVPPPAAPPSGTGASGGTALSDILFGSTGPRGGRRDGLIEAAAKSTFRTIGSSVGRAIVRGMLGSLTGSARRR
jgi:DNA helicase HerA-like ATPase